MRRWSTRLPAAICAASLLLAASGCTNAEGADEASQGGIAVVTPAPVETIPEILSTRNLALPIEAYMLSDKQSDLILRARQTLIQRCMQGFGFVYSAPVIPAPRPTSLTERRYGIADSAIAAEWGYHSPDLAPAKRRQESANISTQTPAELLVLTGWPGGKVLPGATPPAVDDVAGKKVPNGGCHGEAIRQITDDDDENYGDNPLVQAINRSAQSDSDKRVRDAIGKWSECMKKAGYNYPGPLEAVDAFSGPTPSGAERQTAMADVKCKSETNLIGIWFTVESAYQSAAIQQNLEALVSAKTRLESMLRKAASVAGGTVPAS
ncbi:hypothetical protein AB0877_26775 [Micromonospora sp. NPDC047644]|uniref:hypothetical protein n=1 Tax=Micromonospora sp. NPDC047644 TaxID=3157203 RepID=UPI0034515DF6